MAKSERKVIGRLLPKNETNISPEFEKFVVKQTGYNDKLGIIPASITPKQLRTIKTKARQGDLGDLYEYYEKMEVSDTRYGGLVGQLKSSIAGLPLKVTKAEGKSESERRLAEDYANLIEENLAILDTHAIGKNFVDAHFKGLRVFELKYQIKDYPYNKSIALISDIRPIKMQKIRMETEVDNPNYGKLKIATQDEPLGRLIESWHPDKILVLQSDEDVANYENMGISRKAMGWWTSKIWAQLWYAQYTEQYGKPHRIARYHKNTGSRVKKELQKFLQLLGSDKIGLFPAGIEVELLNGSNSGSLNTFNDFIKMANDELAIVTIGQAETTGEKRFGSHARMKESNSIKFDIIKDAAMLAGKGWNEFARSLIRTNYGPDANERLFPSVKPLLIKPEDSKTKVETFGAMSENGVPVPMDHYYEETGVPMPKDGDRVLVNGSIIIYGEEEIPNPSATTEETTRTSEESNN